MEDNQEQLALEALGEALKGVQKPKLDEARKLALRSRIQSQLEVPLVEAIVHQGIRFSLGVDVRARIKERVFALIEKTQQKKFTITNFFLFQKKLVAVAMLFFVTFTMFMFMGVSTDVVYASGFTVLDSFEGEVSVERDGEMIELEKDMRIFEKDRIVTGADGKATIRFFDDSVSRLSGETEIVIDVLYRPVESIVTSYVEIDLLSGNMWSKVLNLVEKKSLFVIQYSDVFTATRKAAFNVSVFDADVEVDVYKNVVEVVTPKVVETVVSGEKAVLGQESYVEVTKIEEEDKASDWVKGNLDNDKIYVAEVEETVLATKIDASGVDVEDDFDGKNSFTENALLLMTFDDIKEMKMRLDLAEKKLIAAEVKLNDSNITIEDSIAVEQAISSYSDMVVDYVNFVEDVRTTDYEYAEELEQYVEDKILLQKKNLSLVLPDSPSYEIKETVGELEILIADDVDEEIVVKSGQVLSKLSEAEDVLEKGDEELAMQIVGDYKDGVDNVIKVIDSIDDEEEKDLKNELIDDVEVGIKLLDEIEKMEPVIEAEYGVVIEGDKPLSPLLKEDID
ncbi:MAG: hypothetical protein GWP15_00170 [Nitrospirae bacterium]|nr:hypothetical protein [Nitrospirota bacterium]